MMAFSMFCAIPSPYHGWDEEARPLMTLFLPIVGAWIGAIWAVLAYLLKLLPVPYLLAAAVLCAYPFLVTGFMHFDGFLDTTDAVKSWRDLEERRRILKDPTSGSFAVIACALIVMIQFAAFASFHEGTRLLALIFIPIASRAVAGLAVTLLRPISTSEYAGAYRKGIKKSHIIWFAAVMLATAVLGFLILGIGGLVVPAVYLGYGLALHRAFKSLDGMSGDISGYALTIGELCGIVVLAFL